MKDAAFRQFIVEKKKVCLLIREISYLKTASLFSPESSSRLTTHDVGSGLFAFPVVLF